MADLFKLDIHIDAQELGAKGSKSLSSIINPLSQQPLGLSISLYGVRRDINKAHFLADSHPKEDLK